MIQILLFESFSMLVLLQITNVVVVLLVTKRNYNFSFHVVSHIKHSKFCISIESMSCKTSKNCVG